MSQGRKKLGVNFEWQFWLVVWPRVTNNYWNIRDIHKVRKRQHQNPEFGHTQGEIFKKRAKTYVRIQWGMKLRKPSTLVINWVSSCLSFLHSASTAATYIFTAPNCTTTIISLEPCGLNAEFQHFILSCSISYWDLIKCLYFADTTERQGPKTGWRQGYFIDNSIHIRILINAGTLAPRVAKLASQIRWYAFFQPGANTRPSSSAFISNLGQIEKIFSISALTWILV
jgi:hypothetical protein